MTVPLIEVEFAGFGSFTCESQQSLPNGCYLQFSCDVAVNVMQMIFGIPAPQVIFGVRGSGLMEFNPSDPATYGQGACHERYVTVSALPVPGPFDKLGFTQTWGVCLQANFLKCQE